VGDFLQDNGQPVPFEDFCRAQGILIPEQKFRVLSRACINAKNRMGREEEKNKISENIMEACRKRKKLSRYIRILFQGEPTDEIPNNLRKYSDNTETICNLEDSRKLNSLWGNNFFDNSTKTFLFKLHNNTLGYNYTVTKHVNTVSKDCTFCSINRFEYETVETPLHIFFTCQYVEPVINFIFRWVYNNELDDNISRQDYFIVPKTENEYDSKFLIVFNALIKKYIWECKLRHTVPQNDKIKLFILGEIRKFCKLNSKFEKNFERSSFHRNIINELG
jgi:hypothetical protein